MLDEQPQIEENRNCVTNVPTIQCEVINKSNIYYWQG